MKEQHSAGLRQKLYTRLLIWMWLSSVVGLITLLVFPKSFGILRLLTIVALFASTFLPIAIWWKRKGVRYACATIISALILLGGWPKQTGPGSTTLTRQLRALEGVPYVWGGENEVGIDCSGLLRRAYVRACMVDGIKQFNPAVIKSGLAVWWRDCSAKTLLDGYDGRTKPTNLSGKINELPVHNIQPGDMAITADGIHCLAYLGDSMWIEADPGYKRVLIAKSPDATVNWFNRNVVVVRWTDTTQP